MFNLCRCLSCGLALCLATDACAAGEPGYLARLGPAPLRFIPPQTPKEHRVELPALPPPVIESTTAAQTATPEPLASAGVAAGEAAGPAALTAEPGGSMPRPVVPAAPAPSAPDAEPLVPQMLLKYFVGNPTNAAGNSVLVPFEFRPAQPGGAASSSASYSKGP